MKMGLHQFTQAITSENAAKNSEIEMLESELQRIRREGTTGLQQAQDRAQKVTLEYVETCLYGYKERYCLSLTIYLHLIDFRYDQLLRHCNEQKELVGKEIIAALEYLIAFKGQFDDTMADVERLAEDEFQSAKNRDGLQSVM